MNKQKQSQARKGKIRIGELASKCGVSRATIYLYHRMGLLHKPLNEGFRSSSFYDETHVRMLGRIRYLREQEKLSLNEIKGVLAYQDVPSRDIAQTNDDKRSKILSTAIELFARHGFQDTKISDITEALNIGKGTFYIYYKDKRELFLDCIGQLTTVIIPKERWGEVRSEKNPILRIRKRTELLQEAFPNFVGILNSVRYAIRSDDEILSNKGKETLRLLSRPPAKDIAWATEHGVFRRVDEAFSGYFLLAMSEMLGYRLLLDSNLKVEDGLDALEDLVRSWLLLGEGDRREERRPELCCGEVTDKQNVKTVLRNIRFDNSGYLIGQHGAAEARVDLGKITSLSLNGVPAYTVILTLKSGKRQILRISEKVILSGESEFGTLTIPLGDVAHLSFFSEQPEDLKVEQTP